MTARSGDWLKNNFAERDPYDYNVDLVDSMGLWTDTLTVGEDGDGDDVIFYGDTASSQLHWDADTDTLELDGTTPRFRIGDFSGSTIGQGSVVSASNTAPFKVYADDGGAAIGSGSLVRAGWFRNLQTYTGGNREQEACGVQGSIVSVAGTNRHNMCGVLGSYEARTSLTVDGQAAATDTWCQAGVIGRVGMSSGTLTLNANGVLAGVAAMSNINTAVTQTYTGEYAAFYAGAWASTDDWEIGLLIEDGKTTTGINIGSCTTGVDISGACSTAGINFTVANLNCIKSVYNVSSQLGQYVQGIKIEHTRSADIQPSTGGWWGIQCVLNAGTGYTALDQPAYVIHGIFKGDATDPSTDCVNVARFETQSSGKVEDVMFVSANSGSTVTGDVARINTHVAPTRSILAVQNGAASCPKGVIIDIDATMTTGIEFNTGAAITNLFSVTAAANTSYFLIADAEAGCFPNYSSAGSAIANIKVKIGGTDGYIKVYDAA